MIWHWVGAIVFALFCSLLAFDWGIGKGHYAGYHKGMKKGYEWGYRRGSRDAKGKKVNPDPQKELDEWLEEDSKKAGFVD